MEVRRKPCLPKRAGTSKVKAEVKKEDTKTLARRHLSSALTIECFNFTGQVIKTLDHLGMCTIHEPATTAPNDKAFIGCFVIRRRYEVSDNTQVTEMFESIKGVGRTNAVTESFINDLLIDINHKSREDMRRRDSIVYYAISSIVLNDNGGSVYVPDVDIVVINSKCEHTVIHPNSPRALDLHIEQLYDTTHSYSIEVNDPINGDKPFYINLNDRVFEIKPTKNEYLGEEVRITFKPPHSPTQMIYLGVIDDKALEEIGLFRTYSDADKYGKKLELKKKELDLQVIKDKATLEQSKVRATEDTLELKAESDRRALENLIVELNQKMEAVTLKHKAEMDKLHDDRIDRERQIQLEREKMDLTLQSLRAKDYYEHRAYDRKDSSEFVKFLPVVAGGALALFALLK